MPRARTEAPHGDYWIFRQHGGQVKLTFEIWDGYGYVPVYNNNGTPENFIQEASMCRTKSQMQALAERIYRAGQ